MRNRYFEKAVVLLSFLLLVSFCAAFAEGKPALTLDPAELTLEKGKSQKLAVSLENVENPRKRNTSGNHRIRMWPRLIKTAGSGRKTAAPL